MMAKLSEFNEIVWNDPRLPMHPEMHFSVSKAMIYEPVIALDKSRILVADTARIDAFCKLHGGDGIYIGDRVHISSFCDLNIGGGYLILEDGSTLSPGVMIVTGSSVPAPGRSCSAISPDVVISKSFVRVNKNATIFTGAIILPGVTIGEGAVVAAGAMVNHDVPDGDTWGCVPARRLHLV